MQFQDGETRTINGVPYVRQGGQWHPQGGPATAPAPTAGAPSAAGFTGFIPGVPKADKPKTTYKTLTEAEAKQRGLPPGVYQENSEGKIDKVGEAAPQNDQLQAAIKDLSLDELLASVDRARTAAKSGWATGLTGAAGGLIPGSTRNDFLGYLESIQGGVIMEKLQALKDASKTGASGMGALSEREGQRLAASVSALNGDMSDDAILASLADIERHAKTLKAVADGADPNDPAVQKKYAIPPLSAPGGRAADGTKLLDPMNGAEAGVPALEVEVTGGRDPTPEEIKANPERYRDFIARQEAEKEAAFITKREGAPGVRDIIMQGATLGLSDEAAGVGRGLASALAGENPITGYRRGRDAERIRIADARKQLGYAATPVEIASGFLSANPASALAPFAGTVDLIRQGARSGAAGGALAGFGYGEGTESSVGGGAIGAATGGALGAGVSALSSRFAPRGLDPELAAAADAERVRISRPMIDGDRRAVTKAGVLEADPSAAPVIQEGFANTQADIEAGVSRLQGGGRPMLQQSGGDMVKNVAQRIKDENKRATTAAYDAAQKVDGDPMVDLVNMRANLDAEVRRLQTTPGVNEPQIKFLERVRRDIDQPIPLSAVRDLRTNLRDSLTTNDLGRTRAERRILSAMEAGKADIERALSPEARAAWADADELYQETMAFNAKTLEPLVGKDFDKLTSEQVFDRLKAMASPRGNGRSLASLHRRLTPDEGRDLAATFAESLGRRSADDPFSAALFISQAKNFSKSARETIFGPSGAASFDNLLKLSRRLERAKGEVNRSKTARPVINAIRQKASLLITGLLTGGGAVAGGPVGGGLGLAAGAGIAVTGAARRAMSAKALMNPRVTKWMAEAANVSTPAEAQQAVRRLGVIASREPAIAGEVNQLQQAFSQAFAESADDEQAQ